MRLLDSNIVIYATQPANGWLRSDILSHPFAVSQATRIEVLGWHKLTPQDKTDLEIFLAAGVVLSISDAIADRAIELRQARKFSLGDALIAATALEHDLDLVTRNADDFKQVPGLNWSNPFDQAPTT
jgi:predicted nucleic acid-binding protein